MVLATHEKPPAAPGGFPEDPVESFRCFLFSKVKCWRTLESQSTAQPALHPMSLPMLPVPLEQGSGGSPALGTPPGSLCAGGRHRRKESSQGVQQ